MGMMIRRNRMARAAQTAPATVEKPKKKPEVKSEFSKVDIEKMNFLKLKSLAKKNGVDTEDKDVKTIREEVIKALGI